MPCLVVQSLTMSALKNDKFMRVLLMFDVPTKTKKEQKHATKFRNELIKLGFFMLQFSVYMKITKGVVAAQSAVSRVRKILPPFGNVRVLIITEKQFDNMQILLGSPNFNERVNDDKNLVLFEFDEKIGDYRYANESTDDKNLKDSTPKILNNISNKTPEKKPKKPKEPSLFEF